MKTEETARRSKQDERKKMLTCNLSGNERSKA